MFKDKQNKYVNLKILTNEPRIREMNKYNYIK